MKITKIINNNAIYTKEKGGTELILMGSGIGWNTRVGNTVDPQKIQKSFVLKNQSYTKIQNFLNRVNADALDIAEDIFNKAQEVFGKSLDDQMILALADHISYSLEAAKNGKQTPNLLLREIQMLYPKAYEIGEYGADVIQRKTGIRLPDDEKGFIALHIINSGVEEGTVDASIVVSLTHDIISVIQKHYHQNIEESGFDYTRLLAHIKYLARRIENTEGEKINGAEQLLPVLVKNDNRLKEVLLELKTMISNKYFYELTSSDQVYLAMHILRVTKS